MKEFIVNYWKEILHVVIFICCLVFCLVKKKPIKIQDTLNEIILKLLPGCINSVEINCSGVDGSSKKKLCISLVLEALKQLGYVNLDQSYLDFINQQIEVILSTPQKKVR